MISFQKSFISKKVDKASFIERDEVSFGSYDSFADGGYVKAEKISVANLSFNTMRKVYYANIWVRAIVDRIVDRVCNIQPVIKPVKLAADADNLERNIPDATKKNIDKINEWMTKVNDNEESFHSIRQKLLRDTMIYDAAAFEKTISMVNGEKGIKLYAVSGDKIKLNVNKLGMLNPEKAYSQIEQGREVAFWNLEEMSYLISNPISGRVYGISPIESLHQTVTAELSASQYNLDFFKNNATPRIAIMLKGLGLGQGNNAMQRFKKWWDSELQGNPHRPIFLGTEQGEINLEKVSMSNNDMQFTQYVFWLLIKIMAVYKMQPAIMGISAKESNPGDITSQLEQFKIDAISPQLSLSRNVFNKSIIRHKYGFGMTDCFMDFELEIGDAKAKSDIDEKYSRMGAVTINEIRHKMGMIPVYWGNIPYLQNNVAPFGAGPNGNAVPGNPEEAANVEAKQKSRMTSVLDISKSNMKQIKEYIAKNDIPVGWETMEINERLDIIKSILREKEAEITKMYIYANK